jgi:glycosyltransferase involved in cell wall biosynthesis
MRIVLATTATEAGGVWRHITDLAAGLRDRGHEVRIGLRDGSSQARLRAESAGFQPVGLLSSLGWADVWHLHLHDTFEATAAAALGAASARGPTVVTEHLPRTNASDPALLTAPSRTGAATAKTAFKRLQARLADRVVCVSEGSRSFLARRYGVGNGRVEVIPNGVDAGRAGVPAPSSGPFLVVVPGALIFQKGHDVLLEAVAHARRPWSVVVVGDGPHRGRLEAAASELGDGRVTFLGWRADIELWLAAAHVVCLPSRWEACPYSALEAMAAGRAVVGSRVDGLDELVLPGDTGLLVRPGDPAALARAVDELADQPDAVAAMGAAGHERVRARFDRGTMVERTAALYEAVAG